MTVLADFDFGTDAPWKAGLIDGAWCYWDASWGMTPTACSSEDYAKGKAFANNLLHFGPALLSELTALRTEIKYLRACGKIGGHIEASKVSEKDAEIARLKAELRLIQSTDEESVVSAACKRGLGE